MDALPWGEEDTVQAGIETVVEAETIRMARGKVRRLKSARAGNTISVVKGTSCVQTKTAKVEHDTRKGVVDQVKLANAWPAPILRRFLSSRSFLTKFSLFMKAVLHA